MPLWEDEFGRLIEDENGRLLDCDDCPCGGSSSSGSSSSAGSSSDDGSTSATQTEGCEQCPDGAPYEWTISVSGVTNDVCSTCDNYNGNFTLTFTGGECLWRSPGFVGCNEDGGEIRPGRWELQYSEGNGRWELRAIGWFSGFSVEVSTALYVFTGTFDCMGPNTFSLNSNNDYCSNWPASITINPA